MDNLIYIDLINKYLDYINDKTLQCKIGNLVGDILFNNFNRFVFNEEYIKKINVELSSVNSSYQDYFKNLIIKQLFDNNQIISASDIILENDNSIEKMFEYLSDNSKKLGFIPLSYNYEYKKCGVLKNAQIPNCHWIKEQLVSKGQLAVWPYNFENNNQIQDFFNELFDLCKYMSVIYIQDDYCNINKHSLFNAISKKGYKINYYLCKIKGSKNTNDVLGELKSKKNSLQERLGRKTKIFYSFIGKMKHPRRILFNNFIIKVDNDWASIDKLNDGWNIDVYYDPVNYSKIIAGLSSYKELL
ncbi:MAG: hypothetical protein V1773_04685 [bacterium]